MTARSRPSRPVPTRRSLPTVLLAAAVLGACAGSPTTPSTGRDAPVRQPTAGAPMASDPVGSTPGARGFSIDGRVLAGREPVENATVFAIPQRELSSTNSEIERAVLFARAPTANTEAGGRFSIDVPTAGIWSLHARIGEQGHGLCAPAIVEVPLPVDALPAVIRVFGSEVRGRLWDSSDANAAERTIWLIPPSHATDAVLDPAHELHATRRPGEQFTFPAISPGRWLLRITDTAQTRVDLHHFVDVGGAGTTQIGTLEREPRRDVLVQTEFRNVELGPGTPRLQVLGLLEVSPVFTAASDLIAEQLAPAADPPAADGPTTRALDGRWNAGVWLAPGGYRVRVRNSQAPVKTTEWLDLTVRDDASTVPEVLTFTSSR